MDRRTTYLSFWDIEMSNIPVETPFRRRVLSTAEARSMVNSARASGTLICVAQDDLGAPYCEREREKHSELCAVLRDHADIDIHLKDFFGDDCALPLCVAEIGNQRSLLVVDCGYVRVNKHGSNNRFPNPSDLDEAPGARAERLTKELLKMRIAPETIRFYVFEQVEADAGAARRAS
jgi:hypothetical protein